MSIRLLSMGCCLVRLLSSRFTVQSGYCPVRLLSFGCLLGYCLSGMCPRGSVHRASVWLLQIGQKLEKWQWRHNFPTWCDHWFFWPFLFLFWSLVTGPSFMPILSLVLELWQFSFIRDWPEIRKSEISPSAFCPISGDWVKLLISNLAQMSLIKCYWMLQNARITAFTVFELLKENQQGEGGVKLLPPIQIRIINIFDHFWRAFHWGK